MKFGTFDIEKPLILAPMEDVSNKPFRIICKQLGADVVVTEFTSSEALLRDIPKAIDKIDISNEKRPVGIQLFGSVAASMEAATRQAERFKPDFIDINCGCWVRNHVSRGEGAGLLKDLPKMEKIVQSVVKSTKLPVTVKTRLGWDAQNIVIMDVAKMLEQTGVQALTIHCRTRNQAFKGIADWTWLEKVKKAVSIPIIGNGDVVTCEDVKRILETGCDGVMIGRGAVSNPWIFQQAKHYLLKGKIIPEPNLKEKIELCISHLKLSVKIIGIQKGVIPFRKYYVGYLKGVPYVSKLRSDLMKLTDVEDIIQRLNAFLQSRKVQ